MEDTRTVNIASDTLPIGSRSIGRPKLRLKDELFTYQNSEIYYCGYVLPAVTRFSVYYVYHVPQKELYPDL